MRENWRGNHLGLQSLYRDHKIHCQGQYEKKNHISSVLRLDFKLNSIDAVHFNFCFRKHSLLTEVYVKQFGKFLKKRGM